MARFKSGPGAGNATTSTEKTEALGVIPEAETRVPSPVGQIIGRAKDNANQRAERAALNKSAKRYQVVSSPETVMYDRQRIVLKPGRILDPHSVDIQVLVKQGVQLKALDPLPAPEETDERDETLGTDENPGS